MNVKKSRDSRTYWSDWIVMSEEFVRLHHRPDSCRWLDDSGDPRMTREFQEWFDGLRAQDERFSGHFYHFEAILPSHWGLIAGGGPGHNQRQLQHQDCHLVNADVSLKTLILARTFSQGQSKARLYHVCADVQRLPFKDKAFDFGMSMGVIHHVPDPDAAFREVSRCLKSGAEFRMGLYLRNILLHPIMFPLTRWALQLTGFKLPGRDFSKARTPEEFVRIYDGDENPIGIADTREGWIRRLRHDFTVMRAEKRIFPYRVLGRMASMPAPVLRIVEWLGGYMCCLWLRNKA
ncbi:MAG: class I SAM-dependent methyltransferase [Planctomycetota bacterium]